MNNELSYDELKKENERLRKQIHDSNNYKQSKQEIERALYRISSRFYDAIDTNKAINASLDDLGKLCGASSAYISLFSEEEKVTDTSHEWRNSLGSPKNNDTPHLPFDKLLWIMHNLRNGELIHITDTSKLPEEAKAEKEILQKQAITSLLIVPVNSEKKSRRFVIFENISKTEGCRNDDLKLIQISAQIIVNAIERKQAKEDLKRAKEKAEESDRLKSAFLANMSHEIRTPANAITGFAQMLIDRNLPEHKQKKFLNIIHSKTFHLLEIINDLIDVSKIEANQLNLKYQYFNLNDNLQELYNIYSNRIKRNGKKTIRLQFTKGCEYKNSYIYSDPSRIRQIMDNLLNNAIKFTNEGTIEFGYELQAEHTLRFYVLDTGVGIPDDQQKHIFERFRQGEDSTSRCHEGTGLGLTISKNLVELLGGEIWGGSKEGVGTVFYFTLPYETKSNIASTETQKKRSV